MKAFQGPQMFRQSRQNRTRLKKILVQLSKTQFLRDLKLPPFSPVLSRRRKRAGFSNSVKNRVLDTYSNIFFPSSFYV